MNANKTAAPLDRVYRWVRGEPIPEADRLKVSYQLLEEQPDRIETWSKIVPKVEPGITPVLSLTSLNSVYAEKCIAMKWEPDLNLIAIEKLKEETG